MTCHAPNCANPLPARTGGRPAKFCSPTCKQAAYRARDRRRKHPRKLARPVQPAPERRSGPVRPGPGDPTEIPPAPRLPKGARAATSPFGWPLVLQGRDADDANVPRRRAAPEDQIMSRWPSGGYVIDAGNGFHLEVSWRVTNVRSSGEESTMSTVFYATGPSGDPEWRIAFRDGAEIERVERERAQPSPPRPQEIRTREMRRAIFGPERFERDGVDPRRVDSFAWLMRYESQ